ncbi:ATP-binding protein [Patescibacteria group bacterium]|nr:ATP-binding protein [Patescibacteria group bacterium]
MRIAFVGKGGAGKSTITTSFSLFLAKNTKKPVVVVDADLNIHAPELLGLGKLPFEKHLSHPETKKIIKRWLIGDNLISDLGAFRKTTPPTKKSNILKITNLELSPLLNFGLSKQNLTVFAVGTYQDNEIGASCYHNNLSIFESILNHLDDKDGYLIADMVAGVDSFAGTLHAQFDLICFVAEPTKKSVEVFKNYESLAQKAGVSDVLIAIGNKIRETDDEKFLKNEIPTSIFLGSFLDDPHIREVDRIEEKIVFDKLHPVNQQLLKSIFERLDSLPDLRNSRLNKIYDLHKKYVAQPFVKERYGDLNDQIDPDFKFE